MSTKQNLVEIVKGTAKGLVGFAGSALIFGMPLADALYEGIKTKAGRQAYNAVMIGGSISAGALLVFALVKDHQKRIHDSKPGVVYFHNGKEYMDKRFETFEEFEKYKNSEQYKKDEEYNRLLNSK